MYFVLGKGIIGGQGELIGNLATCLVDGGCCHIMTLVVVPLIEDGDSRGTISCKV